MVLTVISYNCRGLKGSLLDLQNLSMEWDIMFIQEHWLAKQELHLLSTVSEQFSFLATSPLDFSYGPTIGRPYGGLAILWRKSLSTCMDIVGDTDDRVIAMNIRDSCQKSWLLVNVYLPYQCQDNLALYLENIGKLQDLRANYSHDCMLIAGDFNAHLNTRFFDTLEQFCQDENLALRDVSAFGPNSGTFTFISEAHNTSSWLDHVICSDEIAACCTDFKILFN